MKKALTRARARADSYFHIDSKEKHDGMSMSAFIYDGYVDTLWYNCIANIFVQKEYNVIIVVSNGAEHRTTVKFN